jgi:rhodanese-related sulfurtransferase
MTIDDMLDRARSRLTRVGPREAARELESGAMLVDIRPAAQREDEGGVPGAVVIERNWLEWRLDPASDARLPEVQDHSLRVIVFCSAGYTSSLAAASLQELGLHNATDLIGGFQSWQASGLPTV